MASLDQQINVKINAAINGMPQVQAFTGFLQKIKGAKLNVDTAGAERGLSKITDIIRRLFPAADQAISKVEGLGLSIGGLGGAAGIAVGGLTAILGILVGLGGALLASEKRFADAGSKVHDLAQQMGVAAETASTLKFAVEQSGGQFEDIVQPISRFSVLVGEAARNSDEAKRKLVRFGIDPQKDLNDLDGMLAKVFKRIYDAPPGIARMTLAADAFGARAAAKVIPVIETMEGDFIAFKKAAEEAGVVMSTKDTEAADKLGDSLDKLKGIALKLANAFAAEVAPEVTSALDDMSGHMRANEDAARQWGKSVSDTLHGLRSFFESEVGAMIARTVEFSVTYLSLAGLILKTLAIFGRATSSGPTPVLTDEDIITRGGHVTIAGGSPIPGAPTKPKSVGDIFSAGGAGRGGGRKQSREPADTFGALSGVTKENAESVFTLFKDQLERQSKFLKEQLDQRKISIKEYYRQEEDLQRQTIDAEIVKVKKLQLAEQERLVHELERIDAEQKSGKITKAEAEAKATNETAKTQQEMTRLNERLVILMRDRADLAGQIAAEEKKAQEELEAQVATAIEIIDRLNGKVHEHASEISQLLEVRQKLFEQDPNDPFIEVLDDAIDRLGAMDQALQKIHETETQIGAIEGQIGILQERGNRNILARWLSEQKIKELRKEELEILQNELEALEAIGSNSPEIQAQIDGIHARMEQLKNQTRGLKDQIKDTFIDSSVNALTDFFMSLGDIIRGTESLGDAFKKMASAIIQDIMRIIAQLLAMKIVMALLGVFGISTGNTSGGLGNDNPLGRIIFGHAAGGYMPAAPGGRIIRVGEGGHDEVVLTTDPRYRRRTQGLLNAFLQRTQMLREFAAGGWLSAEGLSSNVLSRIPRFAMGDWVGGGASPALAGDTYHLGGVQFVFPNVKDYRGFKQNETAILRDAGRGINQSIAKLRGSRDR